jgi:hypothetical protein
LQGAYNFGTLVNSTKERSLSTHYGEEETHKEETHKEETHKEASHKEKQE